MELISASRVCDFLRTCLESDSENISELSSQENTEGWDSIIQLSLLGMIEDELPGTLDRLPDLAGANSVAEICKIINAS
jgi:acyl carrier protein